MIKQEHIIVSGKSKKELDKLKIIPNETYNEVVKRLLLKTDEYLKVVTELNEIKKKINNFEEKK